MFVVRPSFVKQAWMLVMILGLGVAMAACGGKKSMEGAGDEEQLGTVEDESAMQLEGVEDDDVAQASFDEEPVKKAAPVPRGSTRSGSGKVSSVTVKEGDTLWKIAARKNVYGSGWLHPIIYNVNKDAIKDPNHLEAGLKLKIPRNLSKVAEEMAKEEGMTGQILDTSPLPGTKPTPAPVVTTAVKVKPVEKGSGLTWFLVLLLLVGAGGAFLWWRKKQAAAADQPVA